MAVRVARAIVAFLALLSLGSCQILEFVFGSVFPSTAVLARAQADLSGQIPEVSGGSFGVRVVESGAYGYVVVAGYLASTGNTAFFFDLDLNLKATRTGLQGTGVMVDSSGYIVVGSQLLMAADLSPAAGTTNGVVLSRNYGSGVDGFLLPTAQVANIGLTNGSTALNYFSYPIPWAGGTPPTPAPKLSAIVTSLQLNAILDDGNPVGNVILVLSPPTSGNSTASYFITIAKSSFPGNTIPTDILDTSPHRDNLDTKSFGYAQGSICAYDNGSGSFIRMDPATGWTQGSFYSGHDPSETRFAYRISGGAYYGFDTKSRVLTKYMAWWPEQ